MDWELEYDDLKQYPHFDAPIPLIKARKLVQSPETVAKNAFYPFIVYDKGWQPFRGSRDERAAGKSKPELKTREIRYASRRDAYIFSYYRSILSELYEKRLVECGIESCPIAYRHIPVGKGKNKGKCNIHFARDAFDSVKALENCVVIALDISKFFESLDHTKIEQVWCNFLGVQKLPPDHAAVFKAITAYRYVLRKDVYRRLGYFGPKDINGKMIDGYLQPFDKIPKKLCSNKDFQMKICGKDSAFGNLVNKNEKSYGIPQGAPISDLLANIYLLKFDIEMEKYVRARSGYYWRYSDDLLLVVPGDQTEANQAQEFATNLISKLGTHLTINKAKTSISKFHKSQNGLEFEDISINQRKKKNGLEYLGFRFDGKRVFLRDSTLSGYYRKISGFAYSMARRFVDQNPGRSLSWLISKFNYIDFYKRFDRVQKNRLLLGYRGWTFWTYARRSIEEFGPEGVGIANQMKGHKGIIRKKIYHAIQRALKKSLIS